MDTEQRKKEVHDPIIDSKSMRKEVKV